MEINPASLKQFLQERLPGYLNILRKMVEINSFTANAEGVNRLGELTAHLFSALGFSAQYVQSETPTQGKHLFLTRLADQISRTHSLPETMNPQERVRSLALVSHLDTVFPPEEEIQNDFKWRQAGDKIYGPGCVDIKGGTTMILMILDAIRTLAPKVIDEVNWLVCLNASEEVLSNDFASLCRQKLPVDTLACLIFEGGTPDVNATQIVVARKGRATFQVKVSGRSAHAGNYHRQGANAILQISQTIQEIQSFTDYDRRLTFNVGTVSGGTVVNRVPHYAEASVEMRALTPEVFEAGYSRIMALDGCSSVSSQDGFPCRVSILPFERTAPWPRNTGTDCLYQLWSEAAGQLGTSTTAEERGGLSDGNLLWQSFPTLDALGPTGANAHCSELSADGSKEPEYVLVSSFIPRTVLNTMAILKLVEQ
jgi:glutamate carboxypeptidase